MNNTKDKLKLILCAFVLAIISILLAFGIADLGVSKPWQYYIYGCMIYIVGVCYLVYSFLSKHKITKFTYPILFLIVICVISLSFGLFYSGYIQMPGSLSAYLAINMIAAPGTIIFLEYLTKVLKNKKREP
jgi:hypothetical protein